MLRMVAVCTAVSALFAGLVAAGVTAVVAREVRAAPVIAAAAPVSNAFTYQGKLQQTGANATGPFDFEFALFDAATGGAQVGAAIPANGLAVTNGLFAVQLDFGAAAFRGDARWLEVRVRANGGGPFETVGRQELTATPYALYAKAIPLAGSGSSTAAAHSDHDHLGQAWTGDTATGLKVTETGTGTALAGTSATGTGVYGESNGPGYGVQGKNATGIGGFFEGVTGVSATASASSGAAVFGFNPNGLGIYGRSNSANSAAVFGFDPSGTGVRGDGPKGVLGRASFDTSGCDQPGEGFCYGTYGEATGAGDAGYGGIGAYGEGSNTGVWGVSKRYGVFGQTFGADFAGVTNKDGDNGPRSLGLIAQEVRPIVPEAVAESDGEEHTLGIDYTKLVPVLIRAIQEQEARIAALEAGGTPVAPASTPPQGSALVPGGGGGGGWLVAAAVPIALLAGGRRWRRGGR